MKKLAVALTGIAAFAGPALAADISTPPAYTKAPVMPAPVANWTGFYVFGGAGGGLWNADDTSVTNFNSAGIRGTKVANEPRTGGNGAFGTVGAGYDWQFNRSWVAGVFADGQFGDLRGSIINGALDFEGTETLRDTWAVGARLGYLVAPNVLSYVNAGFAASDWSGSTLSNPIGPPRPRLGFVGSVTTPSFTTNGWFIGGGVENSLDILGISVPGLFMKTEYRAAYFSRVTLPETASADLTGAFGVTASGSFKPLEQTISTSLVYRFNSGGSRALAADIPARTWTKAPAIPATNWTGFYVFGGVGGGLWNADRTTTRATTQESEGRTGGNGAFGTVGVGFDWQFDRDWVAGVFTDGQFGSLRGSITDVFFQFTGQESLRDTWAVGARLGYLVAPNVYSYVNAGYTGSNWSGSAISNSFAINTTSGGPPPGALTTPSFAANGWFIGGGVENSLNIFGISAPGWFMKSEYRAAFFSSKTLPETAGAGFPLPNFSATTTFKPLEQTVSTSLVYRFNWGGPVVAKY